MRTKNFYMCVLYNDSPVECKLASPKKGSIKTAFYKPLWLFYCFLPNGRIDKNKLKERNEKKNKNKRRTKMESIPEITDKLEHLND
jgi:hypothetical protein